MKKLISVILAGFFALSLSACSNRYKTGNFNANENPPMWIAAANRTIN